MKPAKFIIAILILMISLLTIHHFIGGLSIADEKETVIQVTAKKFEYSPKEIRLKKGVPVVMEFTSLDRLHGFNCPSFKIRSDIFPGKKNLLRFTPDKAGSFPFHCDNFCGSGHEGMTGTIIVEK
ncbi:MAG TPA: cupredoxin domain-containing protein [Syntrophales bacterium]|nr:cupredoxin domain-containing protein [Syntrophales bacterium]